jgi:adenosylhomocysteine nucleosidase
MPKIAIVAALEREVRPLVKHWRVSDAEHAGRSFRFFENDRAVLVCGGIGPEAARRAAESVIVRYTPDAVYSVGYAGALDPNLTVGHLISPGRVLNASDGSSVAIAGGDGILVSYSQVANPGQKSKLRESYSAQAVDMEAAAVARAAEARGREFRVLKVISDEANFDFPSTERFVDSEGRFQEMRFALFAAVRPWLWPGVIRLSRNSNRASKALCARLEQICGDPASAKR